MMEIISMLETICKRNELPSVNASSFEIDIFGITHRARFTSLVVPLTSMSSMGWNILEIFLFDQEKQSLTLIPRVRAKVLNNWDSTKLDRHQPNREKAKIPDFNHGRRSKDWRRIPSLVRVVLRAAWAQTWGVEIFVEKSSLWMMKY